MGPATGVGLRVIATCTPFRWRAEHATLTIGHTFSKDVRMVSSILPETVDFAVRLASLWREWCARRDLIRNREHFPVRAYGYGTLWCPVHAPSFHRGRVVRCEHSQAATPRWVTSWRRSEARARTYSNQASHLGREARHGPAHTRTSRSCWD